MNKYWDILFDFEDNNGKQMGVLLNNRLVNCGICGIYIFFVKRNNEKKKILMLCEIWFLSRNEVKSMVLQVLEVLNF